MPVGWQCAAARPCQIDPATGICLPRRVRELAPLADSLAQAAFWQRCAQLLRMRGDILELPDILRELGPLCDLVSEFGSNRHLMLEGIGSLVFSGRILQVSCSGGGPAAGAAAPQLTAAQQQHHQQPTARWHRR